MPPVTAVRDADDLDIDDGKGGYRRSTEAPEAVLP